MVPYLAVICLRIMTHSGPNIHVQFDSDDRDRAACEPAGD